MRKTFKYRIYANKETITKAENWLELCRSLYNCALAERIYAWKMQRTTLSCFDQTKELPNVKLENQEYKQVDAQVLQDVLERLDRAYKSFFKHNNGYPRFKGKNRYDSFTLKQWSWKLDDKYLSIRNVGRFKLKLSRLIQGDIKTVTIHRTASNKWYSYFSCNNVPERRLPQSNAVIGLDVGIKSFLTDSEGNKVDNPKFLKHSLQELRVRQRKLRRAIKGSNRRKTTKLQLAKCHEKITNQRRDFQYKLANLYVKYYGTIIIETLPITMLMQNHKLAREINDCAWGQFFRILKWKAEEAATRKVKAIPRSKPSSKMCSCCGAVNDRLKLGDRSWVCTKCGAIHDRDKNAAKNIVRFGQNLQAVTQGSSLYVA